jgi:hypothetical protein
MENDVVDVVDDGPLCMECQRPMDRNGKIGLYVNGDPFCRPCGLWELEMEDREERGGDYAEYQPGR